MDFSQLRLQQQETARQTMFQNSGYQFERRDKKTLIVDVEDSSGSAPLSTASNFKVSLLEPLIIDKLCDIYLDNFSTFNSLLCGTNDRGSFSLQINEFNVNSNCASTNSNQHLFNRILIPNEHNSISDVHSSVIHKGKKMNYICSVNPGKITSITGKITDLGGNSIFNTANSPVGDFKLHSVSIDALDRELPSGTIIKINGVATTVFKGITAVYHNQGSTTLYFYVLVDTAPQTLSNSLAFEFFANDGTDETTGSQIGTDKSTTAETHREGDFPRFTAEFVLMARH